MGTKEAISAANQAVLRRLTITDDSPGPILRDFETFLEFVEERQARVGGTRGLLHGTVLAPLNARLSRPTDVRLQRPIQKSFPYVNGLYLLARVTGLVSVEGTGAHQMLAPNAAVLASWRSLNPTERYFTLLQAWLFEGYGEIVGEERGGRADSGLYHVVSFLRNFPKEGREIGERKDDMQTLAYFPGLHHLALLDLFGLVAVTSRETEPGGGWRVAKVEWTAFGRALFALLKAALETPEWFARMIGLEEEADSDQPASLLRPLVQEYFPEWQSSLALEEEEYRGGVHVFKVSLGKVWRLVEISGEDTLDSLAYAILRSVRFDTDHLFMFTFKNRRGLSVEVKHPYTEDPPLTDEVRVGEVPLTAGQSMTFIFDFGDWWKFDVKLERVDADRKVKAARVVESHGEAPRQYRGWD